VSIEGDKATFLLSEVNKLEFREGDIDDPTPTNIAIQTGYNAALEDVKKIIEAVKQERTEIT
jgi:hypothetical protein